VREAPLPLYSNLCPSVLQHQLVVTPPPPHTHSRERTPTLTHPPLSQVVVPKTYSELTSRRVLTVSWLDGEKLSQSKADDVGDLVNIGVISYLKQLLDTGFFHADPHPGNLIRTPDGRLAILDFGLVRG